MTGWTCVKYTEAGQITDMMAMESGLEDGRTVDPQTGYEKIQASGKPDVAVSYLTHALPRLEAIALAANVIRNASPSKGIPASQRQALDSSIRWLEEPTDQFRRAAWAAASRAPDNSPERLLGCAIFMSGGSISDPDLPPVQPAPQVCSQLAAAAILVAAYSSPDPRAVLAEACGLGEKLAIEGAAGLLAS